MESTKLSRIDYLKMRVTLAVSRGNGRRRVWNRINELETKLSSAYKLIDQIQSNNISLEFTISELLDIQDRMSGTIEDLHFQLEMAQRANIWNSHTVDFVFPERDTSDFLDQATAPISMSDLYAAIEEITGSNKTEPKVISVDPDTGIARTVETQLPEPQGPFPVATVRIAHREAAFSSPTHVPGMKISRTGDAMSLGQDTHPLQNQSSPALLGTPAH